MRRRVADTTLRDARFSLEPSELRKPLHALVREAQRRKALAPDLFTAFLTTNDDQIRGLRFRPSSAQTETLGADAPTYHPHGLRPAEPEPELRASAAPLPLARSPLRPLPAADPELYTSGESRRLRDNRSTAGRQPNRSTAGRQLCTSRFAMSHKTRLIQISLACSFLVACAASGAGSTSGDRTPGEAAGQSEAQESAETESGQSGKSARERTTAEEGSTPEPPGGAEPSAPRAATLPEACASGSSGDACAPPPPWVSKLCNGVYAEVALLMFRGGTPWQRLYLRGKTRAVNASGGATVDGFLVRDEEVLVLRHRTGSASGMQIGDGSGQYDVLRWNGSCVSLEAGEVTTRRPQAPGQARVEWRWLGDSMRSALRKDQAVTETFLARKKECKGATTGTVSKACERLDLKLIDRIAAYVRSGPELPPPEEHP